MFHTRRSVAVPGGRVGWGFRLPGERGTLGNVWFPLWSWLVPCYALDFLWTENVYTMLASLKIVCSLISLRGGRSQCVFKLSSPGNIRVMRTSRGLWFPITHIGHMLVRHDVF